MVGDGTSVGAGAVIANDVQVYPFKRIEPAAVVASSLIWESRGRTTLFGADGVSTDGLLTVRRFPAIVDTPRIERATFHARILAGDALTITEQQRWVNDDLRVPELFHHLLVRGARVVEGEHQGAGHARGAGDAEQAHVRVRGPPRLHLEVHGLRLATLAGVGVADVGVDVPDQRGWSLVATAAGCEQGRGGQYGKPQRDPAPGAGKDAVIHDALP